ncbi:site-specific integrase [Paenibacillus sp. 1P03SA]|uniref:site-specific integrase n=1 Tax=Paenibacillus sp. 1P03SA TaxID=3132294 RepID=UPI0039A317C8
MSTESTRSNPKFLFMSKRTNAPIKLDLETEIANFLYANRIEKRSPKTISAYEQALGQFAKWYRANSYEQITPDLTRKYVHYLTFEKKRWDDHPTSPNGVKGLSPRTVDAAALVDNVGDGHSQYI